MVTAGLLSAFLEHLSLPSWVGNLRVMVNVLAEEPCCEHTPCPHVVLGFSTPLQEELS